LAIRFSFVLLRVKILPSPSSLPSKNKYLILRAEYVIFKVLYCSPSQALQVSHHERVG